MPRPLLLRLVLIGAAAGALCACQSFRDAAGLTKKPPDEFAVVTKAPLIIPPDFNLHPPSPGAAPLNQADPTTSAQASLFNNNDPVTVAAGMRGNYTPGEKMLLANAGAQNADPAIRTELQSEARNLQGSDPAFTDKVLNSPVSTATAASRTNPAAIKKERGGWFDWF